MRSNINVLTSICRWLLLPAVALLLSGCDGYFAGRPHDDNVIGTKLEDMSSLNDEAGNDVGYVLHVGTGYARLAVISVPTCMGPRAYAGQGKCKWRQRMDRT